MIKVFIVDDHKVVINGILMALEREPDIQVVGTASDSTEAMTWMISNDFDVAIMDISMPSVSGLILFKNLIRVKPEARVLFFSMHPPEQHGVAAMKLGAKGYLRKDEEDSVIIAAIRRIHSGRRYIPDYVTDALLDNDLNQNTAISQREVDIIKLIANGKSNNEIAETLYISAKTVSSHKSNFMKKLNLKTNSDIFMYAMSNGLVKEDRSSEQQSLWHIPD